MSTIENIKQAIIKINKSNREQVPDYIIDVIQNSDGMQLHYYQGLLNSIEQKLREYHDSMSLDLLRFSHLPIKWPSKTASATDVNAQLFARAEATKCLAQDGIAIYMVLDQDKNLRLHIEDLKGRNTPLVRVTTPTFYQGDAIDPTTDKTHQIQVHVIEPTMKFSHFVPDVMAKKIVHALQNTVWFVSQANHDQNLQEIDSVNIGDRSVTPIQCNMFSPRIHEQLRRNDPAIVDYLANAAKYGPTRKTIKKIVRESLIAHAPDDLSTKSKVVIEALRRELGEKTWFSLDRLVKNSRLYQIDNAATLDDSVFEFATTSILSSGIMLNPNVKSTRSHQSISLNDPSAKAASPPPASRTPTPSTKSAAQKNIDPQHLGEVERVCKVFDDQKGKVDKTILTSLLISEVTDGALLPLTLEDINALNGIVSGMLQFPGQRDLGASWLSNIVHERQLAMLQRQEIAPPKVTPARSSSKNKP